VDSIPAKSTLLLAAKPDDDVYDEEFNSPAEPPLVIQLRNSFGSILKII
jgi:hypothetical protein